jgi:hypothetical protein
MNLFSVDTNTCKWKRYVRGNLYTRSKFVIVAELSKEIVDEPAQ